MSEDLKGQNAATFIKLQKDMNDKHDKMRDYKNDESNDMTSTKCSQELAVLINDFSNSHDIFTKFLRETPPHLIGEITTPTGGSRHRSRHRRHRITKRKSRKMRRTRRKHRRRSSGRR